MKNKLIKELEKLQNKYKNKEKYVVINEVIDDTLQIVNKYTDYDYIQDKLSEKIKEIKSKNSCLTKYPDKYEYCMLKIKSIFHSVGGNKKND